MKELILDYMRNTYDVIAGLEVHTFDGTRVYYDDIVTEIKTIFQLDDNNCSGIIVQFFWGSSLDYGHFKETKEPKWTTRLYSGNLMSEFENYICGIDIAHPDGDVTVMNIIEPPENDSTSRYIENMEYYQRKFAVAVGVPMRYLGLDDGNDFMAFP